MQHTCTEKATRILDPTYEQAYEMMIDEFEKCHVDLGTHMTFIDEFKDNIYEDTNRCFDEAFTAKVGDTKKEGMMDDCIHDHWLARNAGLKKHLDKLMNFVKVKYPGYDEGEVVKKVEAERVESAELFRIWKENNWRSEELEYERDRDREYRAFKIELMTDEEWTNSPYQRKIEEILTSFLSYQNLEIPFVESDYEYLLKYEGNARQRCIDDVKGAF